MKYQSDYYGWLQDQSELLKSGDYAHLDIPHLLEEIDDMGKAQKNAAIGNLRQLLLHLLKWQYQPAKRSRSWEISIEKHRINCQDIFLDNAGFQQFHAEFLTKAYRLAVLEAERQTGLEKGVFPEVCAWTVDQVLTDGWFPTGS